MPSLLWRLEPQLRKEEKKGARQQAACALLLWLNPSVVGQIFEF